MLVKGNTFVVTGGASGLGEQVVRDIVAHGGNVIIMDLNETRAKNLVAELGSQAYSYGSIDVTSESVVKEALDFGVDYFKDSTLVGAVLCAGVFAPAKGIEGYGPDSQLTGYAQFKSIVTVNLFGTYNVAQQVAQRLISNELPSKDNERGILITVSSVLGLDGALVGYGTSKAGVAGLTLPLAKELAGFGIRVMSIAPGPFDTPIFDQTTQDIPKCLFPHRSGEPKEFSEVVLNIINNVMFNGSIIRLDGGIRI
ncbi:hypothetical protein BDF14DRAFT_1959177 [Spinellus fusiger]|nr:hypothetical protein BDF14DRAFT_1959177 [Spinellus fusiger]